MSEEDRRRLFHIMYMEQPCGVYEGRRFMKAGKLSEAVLKRSVLRMFHRTAEQVQGPGVGADCSVIAPPHGLVAQAVSTMPLAGMQWRDGRLSGLETAAVSNAVNNIVCSGAEPLGVLVNLLLPTSFDEQKLRDVTAGIETACAETGIAVLGGHTEVVRSVREPVLTVTAVGSVEESGLVCSKGVRPGMDIVMTKWAGLMGTAVLAHRFEEQLCTRYPKALVDTAKRFDGCRSVCSEAAVAAKSGAAAMHDVSEGGIYGALWELAQCSGVGLDIELKKIPIRQETVEICEFFDVNPYKLLSTGSLLMAADDGDALAGALMEAGVSAAVIGRATDSNDRVLVYEEERRFLEFTQTDELWRVMPG